jgi:hypothetical protein
MSDAEHLAAHVEALLTHPDPLQRAIAQLFYHADTPAYLQMPNDDPKKTELGAVLAEHAALVEQLLMGWCRPSL